MEFSNNKKKKLFTERLRFVTEVVIVFIGIFLFTLIPIFLLPLFINKTSIYYGPSYYFLRALGIIIAIPLFLFISNILLESQKKDLITEIDESPAMSHLKLYSMDKESFKDQLLYGILILFIIFIPLDFLIYLLIPQMLEYSGVALTSYATDSYLLQSYFIFLFSVIIIQICVAIYEESLTRGFLAKRGGDYFHKMSAVIISSLYFGIMHFAYFFNPISRNYPIWFPFVWFLQTFLVAIMLGILILKKKRLFPLIFAHAVNNIISAHAVWNYLQGNDFSLVAIYLYLPLLIISVVLFIWQFPRIKQATLTGLSEFKTYFKKDEIIGESNGDLIFRLFVDFLIGLFIIVIGFLLI